MAVAQVEPHLHCSCHLQRVHLSYGKTESNWENKPKWIIHIILPYILPKKNPYGSPDLGNIWYGSMNCGLNLWKNSSCAMICTMDIHGMLRLLVRCSSWILPHGELQIHLLWAFLSCPGQRLGWRAWGKASYGCAKEKGDRVKTCKTLGFVFNTNHCFKKKLLLKLQVRAGISMWTLIWCNIRMTLQCRKIV